MTKLTTCKFTYKLSKYEVLFLIFNERMIDLFRFAQMYEKEMSFVFLYTCGHIYDVWFEAHYL